MKQILLFTLLFFGLPSAYPLIAQSPTELTVEYQSTDFIIGLDDLGGFQPASMNYNGDPCLIFRVGQTLVITLKYGPSRERSIAGLRRVSKPGLRVYAKSNAMPRVLGGLGIAIISTSTGLLTDRQAQAKGVGGEVLAYVW